LTEAASVNVASPIFLKPTAAQWKVAIIVCADRLNVHAANAFLKTLEEPPRNSIIILLSTEPQRVLETILSRCLRLNLTAVAPHPQEPGLVNWLTRFAERTGIQVVMGCGWYREPYYPYKFVPEKF
jgi:DNA polymerase-3 subunit delta'